MAETNVSYIFMWDDALGSCEKQYGADMGLQYVQWNQDLDSNCCEAGLLGISVMRSVGIAIVWILILFYIFMGVALGAEVFMTAIEVITSKESTKRVKDANGEEKKYHVRVWNATVANLTLMALGSSAPEILLSVIEVVTGAFNAGELGPSTIVGSAAFNLMVITAVCIVCLPNGEKRTLKQLGVFLTTAFYSVLAYLWLFFMVIVWTPEVITVEEGILTCLLLVLLILQAYIADKYATSQAQKKFTSIRKDGMAGGLEGVSKSEAAAVVKAASLGKDATPDEIHEALAEEMLPPKSKAYYRAQAMSGVKGKAKVAPLGDTEMNSVAIEGGRAKRIEEPGNGSASFDPTSPGMLKWVAHAVDVMESAGSVEVSVERTGGAKGEVSCSFATKNQKAVAGKDYEEKSGTLSWKDGETQKQTITIIIHDDDEFEKDEEFTVVLTDPTNGASFPHHTDGGDDEEICTVTIVNDDDRATKLVEAMRLLRVDYDSLDLASEDWAGALKEAIFLPSEGGAKAKVMHILMMPWKLLFALCPPAGLCGGLPCFVGSLLGIAFQVILINDFASQAGCQMYLKKSVTAITFVALGTSLPDTFASMQAARGDKYADNSVGNVTGSNSVNVFFGLGLPWLIGALYWSSAASSPAMLTTWDERFNPTYGTNPLPGSLYNKYKDTGAFIVRAGDLGLSVIVFTVCAIITLGLILVRRAFGKAELGGNRTGAIASAILLVFLWFMYITLSTMTTYGVITVNMVSYD